MYRGGEYSTANIPSIKCTMSSNTLHGEVVKRGIRNNGISGFRF